jgi:hypothetical protein
VGYWSVLDLDPGLARLLMHAGLCVFLGAFWWVTGQRWTGADDAAGSPEFAGLLLLMLLLSPVTWNQHLPWTVPAVFFLLTARGPRWWTWSARGAVAVFALLGLVQSRAIVGRPWDEVMLAWHSHTAALVLLLAGVSGWLLSHHRTQRAALANQTFGPVEEPASAAVILAFPRSAQAPRRTRRESHVSRAA